VEASLQAAPAVAAESAAEIEVDVARVPAWVVEAARQSVPGLQLVKARRSSGGEGLAYRLQVRAGGRGMELAVFAREILAPATAAALAYLRLGSACASLHEAEGDEAMRGVYAKEARRLLEHALESTRSRSELAGAILDQERIALQAVDARAPLAADVEAALAEALLHELRILWLASTLEDARRLDLGAMRKRARAVAEDLEHLVQGCDALVYESAFARASGDIGLASSVLDRAASMLDCWESDSSGRRNPPQAPRDTLVLVLLHQLDMLGVAEHRTILRRIEEFEARIVAPEASAAWPDVLELALRACRANGDEANAALIDARLVALGRTAAGRARSGRTPSAWMPRMSTEIVRLPRPLPEPAHAGPYGPRKPDATSWGSTPDGPAATRAAIDAGLRWLARHQAEDGSWSYGRLRSICPEEKPCYDRKALITGNYDAGLTGLALLAFMANGHGEHSRTRVFETMPGEDRTFGRVVEAGVAWLLARQERRGYIGDDRPFMYNEALAACALIEAHGMRFGSVSRENAQAAVDYLVSAQRPSPAGRGLWGWRYDARGYVERELAGSRDRAALHDADASVTGWCVLTLKAAKLAGLDVPDEAMEGGLAFAKYVTAGNGMVGYVRPEEAGQALSGGGDHFRYHPAVMSALGMCIRMCVEADARDAFLPLAAGQLSKDLPRAGAPDREHGARLDVDYYYWHWGTLALWHHDGLGSEASGGRAWGAWSRALLSALLPLQSLEQEVEPGSRPSCRSGGWIVPDRWGGHYGGPICQTALAVLSLSTPHRYPALLQHR
jgi:hypothetical protein